MQQTFKQLMFSNNAVGVRAPELRSLLRKNETIFEDTTFCFVGTYVSLAIPPSNTCWLMALPRSVISLLTAFFIEGVTRKFLGEMYPFAHGICKARAVKDSCIL